MWAFLKRSFVVLIGLALISLIVWFAGPLFQFASWVPLQSERSRLIAIAAIVLLWLGVRLVRRLRAFRASDMLLQAVARPAPAAAEAPSPEVTRLREQFDEAVATLKQGRRDGHSLYDLPWYVIIGAPGAGKTTALLNSGLRFPLEQRSGRRGPLKGVGGTRNCDWWFAEEAVMLDTAGRYTTQDSDAASDAEGWREFLALLVKHRRRRPLNGVILAVSVTNLMGGEHDREREEYIDAARRRLNELNRELQMELPVYVMVTKCDLVAGFTEYFDDLSLEQRAQVWGMTFPYAETVAGTAVQRFGSEFDLLMARLNARLFARLDAERDLRRRTALFGFPQQMEALREALGEFLDAVFGASRLERPVLLRGVYFTSGTQEGTPVDRLMGAIGRRFGVSADAVAPPSGRGKAYFVQRLISQVMLGESGLAGTNRAMAVRHVARQLALYAALALVAAAGVAVWSWSAARNRAYLDDVGAAVQKLNRIPAAPSNASLATLLPRLDAVRGVVDAAERYKDGAPWGMRWGLYQGTGLGETAHDAYLRELDGALLPRVASRIRERLVESRSEPEALYEYLKAYMMLGTQERLDRDYLKEFAEYEWRSIDAAGGGAGASLSKHFQALLEDSPTIRAVPLDAALVTQAQNVIRSVSIPQLIYRRLQRRFSGDQARVIRLDLAAGVGVEKVLRRMSGTNLSEPLTALYTKSVFTEATGTALASLVAEFSADAWVWGDAGLFSADPVRLRAQVIDLYERDYVKHWDEVLGDLELKRFEQGEMSDAMTLLAGQGSPLKAVLQTITDQTRLAETPAAADAPAASGGTIAAAGKAISDRLSKIAKPIADATGLSATTPGAYVTAHFQPLHRFMQGEPGSAPVDQLLSRLAALNKQLSAGISGGDALRDPEVRQAREELTTGAADAPPLVRALVSRVTDSTFDRLVDVAGRELQERWQAVVGECSGFLPNRYPFTRDATVDLPLADFGRLFGFGGTYDAFYRSVQGSIDTAQRPWAWRAGAPSAAADIPRQLDAAMKIRDLFFPPDGRRPSLDFDITTSDLTSRAQRFILQVDGSFLPYVRGPAVSGKLHWPGTVPMAIATFEDRGGPREVMSLKGPWAWFRMVDARGTSWTADTGVVLVFEGSGHSVRVAVEASSVRNPLIVREWQRFECGS